MRFSIFWLGKPRQRFYFAVFTGLLVSFNTVYVQASSFSVDALTLAKESVLNQSYTVHLTTTQLTPNGNTLASNRQLRYCIDGEIAEDFNYTLTLNNGATWGETLTVDSFWVENSGVSFEMTRGGSSNDSDVTFFIISNAQPISTGVCLVLKDFAINIPAGIESDIEVTAELKTPNNVLVNPTLTTTIIDLVRQFGFEITAPASSEIDSLSTPSNTKFVEEGAADDVLTSHSDTDLLASAAGYSFINRWSEIEDPITLSTEDKLRLTLTPSSIDQLNQISQVVIELDGDGMSPSSADARQTFISDASNGQFVAEILGSQISSQTISDDIVLSVASENNVIDARTFHLTAQLYFYTGDAWSLYEDSATKPAFNLFKLVPIYSSTPAPGSLITLGSSDVGTPTTTTPLTVLEIGDATLEIATSEIIGEQAADFQILQGAAPFSIADGGSPHTILIQCFPGASGLRTAELILTSNDPANRRLNYSLSCTGNSTPKFNARPTPETLIDFGATPIGTPINTTIEISTTETLEILSAKITGSGAEVFQLVGANLPFSLTLDNFAQNLVLECLPTTAGVYSAQLQLETNDPNYLTVTYPLTCLGEVSTVPRLDSTPPPNTILDFGTIPIDSTVTRSILFQASGLTEKLQVTSLSITGNHADDFTVIYGLPPFFITTENPDYVMIIQCHPREVGIHSAFLSLTMPDLNPAEMRYTLYCVGESESPEKSIFSGEIRTQAGAVGENITINEPEQIKITGLIQPAHSHLEQLADLIFIYHWTPVDDETISIPITFAHQMPLAAKMDWVLFEGYAIGFAGHFELELGYRLNTNEFYSDTIAQLEVIPNQAPTDILLDGDTVAENSPSGTVIGSFTTVDADKGEWFFYGLTNNPGGHFKVIGNELQVANGAILNYENGENYPITVRSVDASGDYLEKTFTIQVTDVVATPNDLRLTNKYVLEQSLTGTAVARLITESSEQANYQYELIDDAEGRFYLQDDILLVADSQALDFETQTTHDITARSQATEIAAQIEKTFTIELVNVIDITVTSEIRNVNNLVLPTNTIPTHQPVNIMVHLTPDAEHQGQEAEMISVVLYFQAEQLIGVFALDEAQQWQLWDAHLLTLPSYQRQTLPKKAEWLFHGSFPNEFAGSRLEIYLGYRLIATGELVYSPQQAVVIKIEN
jgi:hypothetical protein